MFVIVLAGRSEGSSKFGILKLDWTTDVPVPLQGTEGGAPVWRGHLRQAPEASRVTSPLPPIRDKLIGR